MSETLSCGRELRYQGRTCQQLELPRHARYPKVKKEVGKERPPPAGFKQKELLLERVCLQQQLLTIY